MSDARFDAIVIGAGLSGLVSAFELQKRGRSVAVVDANDHPGGVIDTIEREGFLVETGANSMLDSTPVLGELFGELGILDERVDPDATASRRYVVKAGRLVALPASPAALLASPLFSVRAKLALLREPFIPALGACIEESIAAFARRRLGGEVLDYAIDPFVSGIYAGDPELLSVRAAFPRLHAMEQRHGGLFRGQLAAMRERRRAGRGATPRSFSFKRGMRTLPAALAARLTHYFPRVRVSAIEWHDDHYLLRTDGEPALRARSLVIATPAYAAAAIVESLAPSAATALRAIDYPPVAVVASAYRREDVAHDLLGFGFLAPGSERRRILGTLFSSSVFPQRAPPGHVLLTSFVGGSRNRAAAALPDDAIATLVGEELHELIGASHPRWTSIVRWPRAIPQYTLGHHERIAAIDAASASWPGLHYCASWRDGASVGDRVLSARATAALVDQPLAATPAR